MQPASRQLRKAAVCSAMGAAPSATASSPATAAMPDAQTLARMLAAATPQAQLQAHRAPGPSLASVLTPAALQERLGALSDPADLAELAQQLPEALQGPSDTTQVPGCSYHPTWLHGAWAPA